MKRKPRYLTMIRRELFLSNAELDAYKKYLFANEEEFLAFKKEYQL